MKRIPIFIIVLLIFVSSAWANDPFRVSGITNDSGLRVRSEPVLAGDVVGSLTANTAVEILDISHEKMKIGDMEAWWYKIKTLSGANNIEGWSYGYFIDAQPADLLALAIWLDRPAIVHELIQEGADVNADLSEEGLKFTEYDEYSYNSASLVEAVRSENDEIMKILLSAGADPDSDYSFGGPGGGISSSALIVAVGRRNRKIVKLLVDAGADMEAEGYVGGAGTDNYNSTPVTAAIENGDHSLLEYLISTGADVNHSVKYRLIMGGEAWKSPLDIAEERGHTDIAALLRASGRETVDTTTRN